MTSARSCTLESLREAVALHARSRPKSVALLSPERGPLGYGALLEQIDHVGRALRALDVGASDRVALVLPNGPQMATAVLGTAAHAACVPLNPAATHAELERDLADIAPRVVIALADADTPAHAVASRMGIRTLDLASSVTGPTGTFVLIGAASSTGATHVGGEGEDTALILHTSGTTSRPKQVPLSHRNLLCSARSIARVLRLSADDRCLNVMPLFHIHGIVGTLLSTIRSGGSIVCAPDYLDDRFSHCMRSLHPTWYSAVPTVHRLVVSLARRAPDVARTGSLRFIRSSSSALSPSLMSELEDTFQVPVIESYGMTEAAHQITSNPLPPAPRKAGSVGVPAGCEVAVRGDGGRLLPAGETGEIVVRGASVTAGYANDPRANEAAFVDGWFRTGDLGYRDDDGYLFLTGRAKEIINRGGEKISPLEIEETLASHASVAEAAAFAVPHPTLGEDACAAVVLHADADACEGELRRYALDRIAAFKVPSRILVVADIPKGTTGKLQRVGLDRHFADALKAEHTRPGTDLERAVVAVLEETLDVTPVGVTDNFFALGGNSLQALRVLARLSDEYQVDLPAGTMFRSPCARDLCVEITRRLADDAGDLAALLDEIEAMPDVEAQRQSESR